jgi:hypothetical protein
MKQTGGGVGHGLIRPGDTHSETGGPARRPAQFAGHGDTKIEIVYGEVKNIFYW